MRVLCADGQKKKNQQLAEIGLSILLISLLLLFVLFVCVFVFWFGFFPFEATEIFLGVPSPPPPLLVFFFFFNVAPPPLDVWPTNKIKNHLCRVSPDVEAF